MRFIFTVGVDSILSESYLKYDCCFLQTTDGGKFEKNARTKSSNSSTDETCWNIEEIEWKCRYIVDKYQNGVCCAGSI